ncbi:SAVED domain-containing protein [uncultured Deefgea sp.]|uniref:SAVED domain-containing protein n=1 Tax=uncultured Deefgea sp. TaxID=1304914 RepID=UPI002598E4CA|nr:SAVED domain-containing protein [uncultured Deefgea sp.]
MSMGAFLNRILNILQEFGILYLRRTPAGMFLKYGVLLMFGGPLLNITVSSSFKDEKGNFIKATLNSSEPIWWISVGCFSLGLIFAAIGGYLAWQNHRVQQRKRIIAIEIRGLTQSVDSPLVAAIPIRILGQREELLIDVRNLVDGTAAQRQKALNLVNLLPERLTQVKTGRDRSDLSVYAGGVASVPLLFLAGTLLASESAINWMDWDRIALRWVPPSDGQDIGALVPITYSTPAESVVLAMAISYPISEDTLSAAFPNVPVVRMSLATPSLAKVCDESSIQMIVAAFIQTIIALQGQGVRQIHLALAAPSVVSLRLGSCFAPRNMPELIVYQFQQAQVNNPYPWGVRMPDSETSEGVLHENNH